MRRCRGAWVLALLLGAAQHTVAASVGSPLPRLEAESYRLPNGLQVVLRVDDRLPLVALNVRYAVGSANDPPRRTGFAHLFEHLFSFVRLRGYGESPVTLLQRAGALQASAVTSPDRTTYFTTIPAAQLDFALGLEAERMRDFEQLLDEPLFSREQAIVRNERRLNVEGKPYGLADEAIFSTLFPPGHPYHHRYIGAHADIEAARWPEAKDFFRRYYRPGNAILTLAGSFELAQARALVARHFGPIPAGEAVPKPEVERTVVTGERRVSVADKIELPRLAVAWRTAARHQPGDAEMSLLPFLLAGPAGTLHDSLVNRQRLAQEVVVEYLPYALGSVLTIKATANAGVSLKRLQVALDAELDAQTRRGWSGEQIDRARKTLELQILRGLEKLGDITALDDPSAAIPYGGVADQLGECLYAFGKADCLADTLSRYRQVTPETLRSAMQRTLTKDARAVVLTVPGEKVIQDVPAASAASTSGEEPSGDRTAGTRLPVPHQFVLPNGLTVLLLERKELPLVRLNLLVQGGSAASPLDQPGLASFATDMLLSGTTRRSASEITGEAAQLGTAVETDISGDSAAVGISALQESLAPAMELLADVALRPAFQSQEVEKMRVRRLSQLTLQRNNPDALASQRFTAMLFGAASPYRSAGMLNDELFSETPPYGYDESGSEESLRRITRDDLHDFWKRNYTPGNAVLIAVGAVSQVELLALARKHFGDWRGASLADATQPRAGSEANSEPRPRVEPGGDRQREVVIIDRGGATQTVLRVGAAVGSPPDTSDYVPLRMLNIVLGEIFSSRITRNLRERNGFTYLARSRFAWRREPGQMFVISTSVRTDATAPAVRELLVELRRIADEPVSAEELAAARNTFLGNLVGRFEMGGDAAAALGQLHSLHLPLDYYRTLPERIAAVTAADIQRVARQYLAVERMQIVALGDRVKIEPALRELRLGTYLVQ